MIENVYPLSPLQEGIYFHWLMDPKSSVYLDQLIYTTQGELEIDKLRDSYHKLVARHAILRTFFTQEFGDKALQVVLKEVPDSFEYYDCTDPDGPTEAEVKKADLEKGFNLQAGSQMRLTVLGMGENTYQFLWSFHHILLDGWCVTILIREFYQFYQAMLKGVEPEMERVYPYVNYIQWLGKIDQAESMGYWKSYLEGYDKLCSLPKQLVNNNGAYELKEEHILLDTEDRQAMKTLCGELGVTENIFFQTVWGILLGIYNNTNDVVFGAVVSGRPGEVEGIEKMIGLFINTIPVRVRFEEGHSVKDVLKAVQEAGIKGTRYHYTQLAHIQAETEIGKDLLDHILVFENYPLQDLVAETPAGEAMGDAGNDKEVYLTGTTSVEQTNYDFNVILLPGDHFVIRLNYNALVYSEGFIALIRRHPLTVLKQVLANPDISVGEVNCITPEEKEQLVNGFNNTTVDYPADKTITQLFEAQVAATPNQTALVFGAVSLTYQQLHELTNQAAQFLRATYDIKPEDVVGVQLERSHWQTIAILAILKAGAAYMPIDTDYPPERVAFMTEDSKCKALITDAAMEQLLPAIVSQPPADIEPGTHAGSLAYIMYTSGSTGQPKGVMVEHGNVVRLVKGANFVNITGTDKVLNLSSYVFDGSVFDIFGALLNGATLLVPQKDQLLDFQLLAQLIEENGITLFFLTTALFNSLVDAAFPNFTNLKYVLVGGERASVEHMAKFREAYPAVRLVHVYGPTENTTFSTFYPVKEIPAGAATVPIGSGISNTQCYVVHPTAATPTLVPIGVNGEICVAGAGLSRGYLNQPGLTQEKFVPNPWVPDTLMYRTGDIGRWLVDGSIEFTGRKDDQVKIRGFRIEPGEIEAALRSYPGIENAVVAAKQNSKGEKELVAYVVSSETITDATALGAYLGSTLPYYMVPVYFVQLPELPLNINGKVDRKKLPDPEGLGISTGVEYVAPRNETEERLLKIWQEILGKEKIGVKDNFFAIGGHSLKATRLASNIRKEFDVNLTLPVLFSNPTIEHIAGEIEKTYWANNELFDIDDAENISL
jgi:amino acid adenylation domain-containing protein